MNTPQASVENSAAPVRAMHVLVTAAVIGIAGDALMRGGVLRLGFLLWMALLGVAVLAVDRSTFRTDHGRERAWLMGGALLAAFGLVWRDSPTMYAVDMLSVLCMGALTIWHGSGWRVQQLTVFEAFRAMALAVINTVGGAFGAVLQSRDERSNPTHSNLRARAITIGIVLAVPPLLIVTLLLVASDKVFDALVQSVVNFLAIDGIQHVVVAIVLAWIAAGWIRAALGNALRVPLPEAKTPALLFMSVGVGLYALVALLTVFFVTQLRVLFGGESFLMSTQGLTVAAYAREGFFQLILAAGIVLATLIAAEWLLSPDDARGRRQFRIAGALLLTLIGTLLISAATRMWLYVREFGLSEDRAFAYAVMLWVVAAIVIFAMTMLRGRADRFAPRTLAATAVWVALLNVTNLQAIVVNVNVARAAHGETFDAQYHATLSADALPSLAESASRLKPEDCKLLSDALQQAWTKRIANANVNGNDWRTLNLPLLRARSWHEAGVTLAC